MSLPTRPSRRRRPLQSAVERLEPRALLAADVRVIVFDDADSDSVRDDGEGPLAEFAAYLDVNDDGLRTGDEPAGAPQPDGSVVIAGVPDGRNVIRLQANGVRYTTAGGDAFTLDVAAGQSPPPIVAGANRNVRVSGAVFDDRNADHVRQESEPGLEGRRVYLDADEDGTFDDDEAFVLTGADGRYKFEHLYGNGLLRVEPPQGWRATLRGEGSRHYVTNHAEDFNFGDFGLTDQPPTGAVYFSAFLDYDGDDVQDRHEPLSAALSIGFLDADADGILDAGELSRRGDPYQFSFGYVPGGTYRPGVIAPPGWVAELGEPFTVVPNAELVLPPLGLRPAQDPAASISGTVYGDDDFDGTRDSGEPGVSPAGGSVVYLDADGDGYWSRDPVSEPATVTDSVGRYAFPGLPAGTYRVGLDLDPFVDTWPVAPRDPAVRTVTVDGAAPAAGVDFGITSTRRLSRAAGRVYRDADGDGAFDPAAGDAPVPNVLVYSDFHRNGAYDNGDVAVLSGPDGRYDLPISHGDQLVAVVVPAGWTAASDFSGGATGVRSQTVVGPDFRLAPPAADAAVPAAIAGTLFHDFDLDGARGDGEPVGILHGGGPALPPPFPEAYLDLDLDGVRDANEPTSTVDDRGGFAFGGLRPGTYAVRLFTTNGWAQTGPRWEAVRVTVAAGERAPISLGAAYAPARVGGFVYNDSNLNGIYEEGDEGPAPGVRVTLDTNGNGLDASDPFAVTNAQGNYTFVDQTPGVLRVGVSNDPNYRQTNSAGAPIPFRLEPGEDLGGLNLGVERVNGTLTGLVFYDANRNGVRDGAEWILVRQGVRVQDTTTPARNWSVLSDGNGVWTLDGVPAGTYRVSMPSLDSASELTTPPPPGTHVVELDRGKTVTGLDFGLHARRIGFQGLVFQDTTGNGSPPNDNTDVPAAGITVYLDANTNGRLDAGELTAVTDAQGRFAFQGIDIDRSQWVFRLVKPAQTVSGPEQQTVNTPTPGTTATLNNRFWYYRPTARYISGTAYDDANASGTRDAGEAPLAGRRIGWDADRDGDLDNADRYATTDEQGWYAFLNVPQRDSYVLREQVPADRFGTSPAGGGWRTVPFAPSQVYTDVDFGSIARPQPGRAAVFGRGVFYYDPALPGAGAPAPATDKRALLPGQVSSFDNVTSYWRGLNGITVDVAGLAPDAALTADDFEIALAAPGAGGGFVPASVAPTVTVVPGAGVGGSHRVALTFPDNTIRNRWLRVTVKPTGRTLLDRPEVFYFGNLVGETGNDPTSMVVNALDLAALKRALGTAGAAAERYDFNRDGAVNALDVAALKQNLFRGLTVLSAPRADAAAIGAAPTFVFSLTPARRVDDGAAATGLLTQPAAPVV